MKTKISITIEENLLKQIEKRRGKIKRSTYIENILMGKLVRK